MMFIVEGYNEKIDKSARFLIEADSEESAKALFNNSFVHQSGMNIKTVTQLPNFYLL